MQVIKEKELEKLKTIVKHFKKASSEVINETIREYIKIEDDKIKMTDGTFLLEIPNFLGLENQYINIRSFLKKGELNSKYDHRYPDFEVVKRIYENPYRIEINIKEFINKVKIDIRKPQIGISMILRIVNQNLFVYLIGDLPEMKKYRKLACLKINNPNNINARLNLDPVKVKNIFNIFLQVKSKKLIIEFSAFNIADWKDDIKLEKWTWEPVNLKTENSFGLLMQRKRNAT